MKRSTHAVAWVLLVVVAVVLWPRQWGGAMTYVITSGTSMRPTFTAGDLAVLRSSDDYRVGEVVAYRSEELGSVVMHRVLTAEDGTYTLRGDDNDFVDPDEVREGDVLGELVLRVPRVGPALRWLLEPVNVLLALGALYLLVADRRREAPVGPAPVVEVAALRVPDSALLAEVADEAALQRLAERYGRPVLRHAGTGEAWVQEGSTVYRFTQPVQAQPAPDQQQGGDVLAMRPRSRRRGQPTEPESDVG